MELDHLEDRVAEVYKDSTVFISGATGFLGKALIEKLLRSTEVKTIYLLIRQKKNKSPSERLTDIFNNPLFDILKKQNPESLEKCVPIPGDVLEVDLGISEENRRILNEQVNFVFHSAATTRFDETIKYAVLMNTRGTKYMLELAQGIQNLKLFVHVSSSYVFPKEEILYERAYDPPADPHQVLSSIDWIDEKKMGVITKELLEDIPNTYTFSKALAEALVNEQVGKIPLIIVRPAVVCPTWKEPFPGWFNNLQGPMGIFVGGGKGVIRSTYMDSRSNANFIPADCTISATLVASWDYLLTKNKYIFNIAVPEKDFSMTWESILNVGRDVINTKVPFNGILWYPGGTLTKNRTWYNINFFLFQLIPALFIDLILFLTGYKPILYAIQMRIRSGQSMFDYYTTKSWKFSVDYMVNVRKKLNAKEKQIYQIEAVDVDIRDYLIKCVLFARRHILKEPDEWLPAAKRNMKIMYVLDRFCKTVILLVVGYYLYTICMVPGLQKYRQKL